MSWKLKEFKRSMFTIFKVVDENGKAIKTFVADQLSYSEKKKKAQLIAAAPELLETSQLASLRLKNIIEELVDTEYEYIYDCITEMVRADLENIINKAKGVGE